MRHPDYDNISDDDREADLAYAEFMHQKATEEAAAERAITEAM